jgi:hypothetical protein
MAPDRIILHLFKNKSQTPSPSQELISAVALATGIVNKTHSFINIVSIEGTGFTESSVVQSVVGKSLRLVMTQWVRHLATSIN